MYSTKNDCVGLKERVVYHDGKERTVFLDPDWEGAGYQKAWYFLGRHRVFGRIAWAHFSWKFFHHD